MNERHISGIVRTTSVGGTALRHAPISGDVRVTGKTIRELIFGPYELFPSVGQEDTLYIATDQKVTYYWGDNQYIPLSAGIDDESEAVDKTWSSSKISGEFEADQAQLDRIGNFSRMTNSEILAIFNS